MEQVDSIETKLQDYRVVSGILLDPFLCTQLSKSIEELVKLIVSLEEGLADMPKIYDIWNRTWNDLHDQEDEKLKALGITRESLLSDKEDFVTRVQPALLEASEKFEALIEGIRLVINNLVPQKKDG